MNQSELPSVWTRMLDGEPLSSEEIAALNAFLATADSQDSQWLTDDFTTDDLLRALHAEQSTKSLSDSASAQFVRRVTERMADQNATTPSLDPPPVVAAPPVVIPPPVASDQDQRSRSISRWILVATAASILLVAATWKVLLSNQNVPTQLANTAQPSTPVVPQPSTGLPNPSSDGNDTAPAALANTPIKSEPQPPETQPDQDKSPIQIALDPSISEAHDDGMPVREPPLVRPVSPAPALADATPPQSASLAAVLQSDNAVWRDGYEVQTDLMAGPLELESGEVRLRLAKGTELTLSGPTKLELIDDNQVSLTAGLITANVPEAAIGFTVQAPGGRIVDLGTRFTVDANPTEQWTVVKVIEGTVDVIQPPVNPRARERKTRMTTGRMKWLPFDGSQAFDWRLVAVFGDEEIKPGHFEINGEAFDVRYADQYQRAKDRLSNLFQAASAQRELVHRGERFSGSLIIDDVAQMLTTTDGLDRAQANLVQRVDQRQKRFRLIQSPEDILNEIQNRIRSSIGNQP